MVAEGGSTHDGVLSCATLAFPLAAAFSFCFVLSLNASVPRHRPPSSDVRLLRVYTVLPLCIMQDSYRSHDMGSEPAFVNQ